MRQVKWTVRIEEYYGFLIKSYTLIVQKYRVDKKRISVKTFTFSQINSLSWKIKANRLYMIHIAD